MCCCGFLVCFVEETYNCVQRQYYNTNGVVRASVQSYKLLPRLAIITQHLGPTTNYLVVGKSHQVNSSVHHHFTLFFRAEFLFFEVEELT